MIIYLFGPDSYRRNKKLRELLGDYKSKHENTDIASFDFEEDPDSWRGAVDFLKQPSMFVQSKIAIIKNATSVEEKEWVNALKKYGNDKEVFILISDAKKPKVKFKFLLEKSFKKQEFEKLEGSALKNFIEKEAARLELRFGSEALSLFLNFLESSQDRSWLAINELLKIKLAGFKEPVGADDLKKLLPAVISEEMFIAGRRFLGAKTPVQKLISLERLLSRDESSDHIFNLLAFQAQGVIAEKFADYDILRKSGKLEIEEALLDFALRV